MTRKRLRSTATALRLRSRPEVAADSDTGGRLLAGQLADAWGRSFDDRWFFLQAPGGNGWASAAFLEEVSEAPPSRIAAAWQRLGLRQGLIPADASNRPGTPLRPTAITVHNTANRTAGADAEMHRRYLLGDDARQREVSWHFTVDDRTAIQHLPRDEVGWHAGRHANAASIAVEICEHQRIDQDAADDRAALLVALLMAEESIPLAGVRTHRSWTGKDCPRLLLQTPGGWERFLARVAVHGASF